MISMIEVDGLPSGAMSTTGQAPEHWTNRSVSWTLEFADLGTQMTVWEDGSAQIDFVDMSIVESRAEHRQLDSEADIEQMVEAARAWVSNRPPDAAESGT
jgi:hypothetical protein